MCIEGIIFRTQAHLLVWKIFISCCFQQLVVRYGVGASLSWAFQLKLEQITAVAIETSFQVHISYKCKQHFHFRTAASPLSCSRWASRNLLGNWPLLLLWPKWENTSKTWIFHTCMYCLSVIIFSVNRCKISFSADDNWTSFVAGTSGFENIPEVICFQEVWPNKGLFLDLSDQFRWFYRFCQSKATLEEKGTEYTTVSSVDKL